MSEEARKIEPDEAPEGAFSTPEVEESVAEAEEQDSPDDANSVLEELASSMGWYPQEGGKSAREFIKDTAEINNSLRKRVDRLSEQIDQVVQHSTRQTMQALKEQRERLQKQFDDAVESGDKAAATKASEGLRKLDDETPAEDPQAQWMAKWQPAEAKFKERNAHILTDKRVVAEVVTAINKYANVGMEPDEAYEAVEQELKERFPKLFVNQNRDRPAKVNGDSRPSGKKSNWDKLLKDSPEAESAFNQYVKMGVYKDTPEHREKYAKLALED